MMLDIFAHMDHSTEIRCCTRLYLSRVHKGAWGGCEILEHLEAGKWDLRLEVAFSQDDQPKNATAERT